MREAVIVSAVRAPLGSFNGGLSAMGASGCRILVTLLYEMARRGKRIGMASLCLGGGEAVALIVRR